MFTFFLLLILIVFVIIPLCKLLWRGWLIRQQWKRATQGMRDAFNQAQRQQQAQQQQAQQRKKKIDPTVGEYVAFEEIACDVKTETRSDGSSTTIRTESQVEDAVWEDIK